MIIMKRFMKLYKEACDMEEIVLDFTNCRSIDEVYDIIQKGFDYGGYMGKNLDALWDDGV